MTELMLTSVGAKRVLAMPSQSKVTMAPHKKHPGINRIGFAVLTMSFTKCGTAIPTKDMGPAKAVTHAESKLESRIKSIRRSRTLTPMFLA